MNSLKALNGFFLVDLALKILGFHQPKLCVLLCKKTLHCF